VDIGAGKVSFMVHLIQTSPGSFTQPNHRFLNCGHKSRSDGQGPLRPRAAPFSSAERGDEEMDLEARNISEPLCPSPLLIVIIA